MAPIELQQLIALTPAGGTVDLANKRFDITVPVIVKKPITIVGSGASVYASPSNLRDRSIFVVASADVAFQGSVRLFGGKPVGHDYDATREAQHGIWLQSAHNFDLDGWQIQNVWGDAVYVGRGAQQSPWSQNVTLRNFFTNEIGRQHITLAAVQTANISGFSLHRGYRSVFDIEPPGHDWGAIDVHIHHGTKISGPEDHGYLLSCKGVGNSASVKGIHLDNIICHGRAVSAMVLPPEGIRRQDFSITHCSGDLLVHSTPMRFNSVDGVVVNNITQPIDKNIPLVKTNDCTGVQLS